MEGVSNWWKARTFAQLSVPEWMKELLSNMQPILLALQEKIQGLTQQLQAAAGAGQPRGFGALSSVVIDREVGNWNRFNNRRQVGSYTGLCPGEYSSGNTRVQSGVTKHGNPRLRAALVETAWRVSNPITKPCANGGRLWPKERWPPKPRAKKQSWQ
jgi:transposase